MITEVFFALIVAGNDGLPGKIHSIWPNKSSCIHVMEKMDAESVGGCVQVTVDDVGEATEQLKLVYQLLYAENERLK